MASSPIHVELDTIRTVSQIKSDVESFYTEHKSIPLQSLSIATSSTTPASILLSSAATKSVLSKITATKFWTKPPTSSTLQPLKQIPLIPMLLPASHLMMLLRPNGECPMVLNSFDLIKDVQYAYAEAFKLSQAPTKRKNEIEKQKNQVLGDMLTFTSNTLARLFVRSSESELLLELFLREVYYTSLNILRVFEFTTLDLLLLEEKFQSLLVTPMETELANWKKSSFCDTVILDDLFKVPFSNSYKTTYSISWTEAELQGTYPSNLIQRKHLELSRQVVQDHLFYCGNHEVCGNREAKVKSFAKCSKCKWTRYCSAKCQQEHWKAKHKLECDKPLTESDAEILFKGRRIIIGAEGDVAPPQQPPSQEQN